MSDKTQEFLERQKKPYMMTNFEAITAPFSALGGVIAKSEFFNQLVGFGNLLGGKWAEKRKENKAIESVEKAYEIPQNRAQKLIDELKDFNTYGFGRIDFEDMGEMPSRLLPLPFFPKSDLTRHLNASAGQRGVIKVSLSWLDALNNPNTGITKSNFAATLYHELSHKIGYYAGGRNAASTFVRWVNEAFADGNAALIMKFTPEEAYNNRALMGKRKAMTDDPFRGDDNSHPGDYRRAKYARMTVEEGYFTPKVIREIARDTGFTDEGVIQAACNYFEEIRPRVEFVDKEIQAGNGKGRDPMAYAKDPNYLSKIDELAGLSKRTKQFYRERKNDLLARTAKSIPDIVLGVAIGAKEIFTRFSERARNRKDELRTSKEYFDTVDMPAPINKDLSSFMKSASTPAMEEVKEMAPRREEPVKEKQVNLEESLARYKEKAQEHNAALDHSNSLKQAI